MSLCTLLQTKIIAPSTQIKGKVGVKQAAQPMTEIQQFHRAFFLAFFTSRSLPGPLRTFSSISFCFSHRKKCTNKTWWPGWCCWAELALPACYFWLDPFKLVDGSVSLIYTYLLNSIWQKTQQLFPPPLHRSAEGLMQAEPQCPLNGRKCDGNGCESLLLEEEKRKRSNICSEVFRETSVRDPCKLKWGQRCFTLGEYSTFFWFGLFS